MTSPPSPVTTAPAPRPARPRILWLHTQPEHYFNCMMDDLQAVGEFDFTAAFAFKGPQNYTDNPVPKVVPSFFLTPKSPENPSRRSFWKRYHRDWQAEIRPERFDLAIVSGYGGSTERDVIKRFHRLGIPVAMWSDSNLRSQRGRTLFLRMKRKCKRLFLSRIAARVDLMLTANSRGVAYWRYFGVHSSRILLCPCYSDYVRIDHARTVPREEALRQLQLPSDARYFFTAARLVRAKGLDQMIRAFRAGRFAERGLHYFIAGIGPLEAELKALAGDALDKSIHFLGFQQPQHNLLYIAHADLFVLPSVYEPHGIVVAESMAAGTPVLASDACGAAYDLVVPGITGDFYRSGNAEMLQAKLAVLVSAPEQLATMRVAARKKFETWFDVTSPIKVVHQVARTLLRQTHAVPSPQGTL